MPLSVLNENSVMWLISFAFLMVNYCRLFCLVTHTFSLLGCPS